MSKGLGRIDRERAFHDKRFLNGKDKRDGLRGIYRITGRSKQYYSSLVQLYARDLDVLEIGVGLESMLPVISEECRSFRGIDISSAAVKQAESTFREFLKAGKCELVVCDAEDTHLPEMSVELVFGAGIVHHLDIERFVEELGRLLGPNGRAVFFEPLGYNPLINLVRLITPGSRTPDEHPLKEHDLDIFRRAFKDVKVKYFHLFSLMLIPFCRFAIFDRVYPRLESVDLWAFARFPSLRKFAWVTVVDCAGPLNVAN